MKVLVWCIDSVFGITVYIGFWTLKVKCTHYGICSQVAFKNARAMFFSKLGGAGNSSRSGSKFSGRAALARIWHPRKFIGGYLVFAVWSTPLDLPQWCGRCMHQQSTSGIRRRIRRLRILRRWHSTYWYIMQCEGVGWLLGWFALMTKFMI
jgi:hypothetical protein